MTSRWFSRPLVGRAADLFALSLVALLAYKTLVAPRMFRPPVERAPAFSLQTSDGGAYRLRAHPGHLVFLDFWASWCTPCKIELPLVEGYAAAHPEVEVLAVDVGEPAAVGLAYARAHKMAKVLFDPDQRVFEQYGINGFPTVVVIDPQGFLRGRWEGLNPAIALAMNNARDQFSARPAR